jgi:hypothetical protein
MKFLLTLLLLAPAGACFAQSAYTYVVDAPARLGDESVPAYRTFADTIGKPFTKLFAHSSVAVTGRLGTRWAVVKKGENEYLIRTSDLSAAGQQVVASATPVKTIPYDPATGLILYSEVVQTPGASQGELYARAKLWFADTFKSTKAVVQADDKEAGIIQGTAFQNIYVLAMVTPSPEKLWYTVKIALKDGRYKYDITKFCVQSYPTQYYPNVGEPIAAEGYVSSDQKKGTALTIARSARREIAFAGAALEQSIIMGMSKPAAGTNAGKDW